MILLLVGLIFAMIGLAVNPGVATLVFDAHTTWALDAMGMITGGNFFDFIGFIFDIFVTIFWGFIAPTLGWFEVMGAATRVAGDLTPMGFALQVGMILISLALGVMSLAVEGCLHG